MSKGFEGLLTWPAAEGTKPLSRKVLATSMIQDEGRQHRGGSVSWDRSRIESNKKVEMDYTDILIEADEPSVVAAERLLCLSQV